MTGNDTTGRYFGGPLDGQVAERGGKWTMYRADDGQNLPADSGHREFTRKGGARRYYAHLRDADGRHVYVHLTAVDRWFTEPAQKADA